MRIKKILNQSIFLATLLSAFNLIALEDDCDLEIYNQTNLILKAEELYAATLYPEAILSYKKIMNSIENGIYKSFDKPTNVLMALINCRLGQAHYFSQEYALADQYLEKLTDYSGPLPSHLQKLKDQSLYIDALACRHLGLYDRAIKTLEIIDTKLIQDEIQFEFALNYFLNGELKAAQKHLELVSASSKLHPLSQIYLARINIAEKRYDEAEKRLEVLSGQVLKDDNLHFEIAYYRGETAFYLENYKTAI